MAKDWMNSHIFGYVMDSLLLQQALQVETTATRADSPLATSPAGGDQSYPGRLSSCNKPCRWRPQLPGETLWAVLFESEVSIPLHNK